MDTGTTGPNRESPCLTKFLMAYIHQIDKDTPRGNLLSGTITVNTCFANTEGAGCVRAACKRARKKSHPAASLSDEYFLL
jgi:hypothetical protein